jgi:hypothetical protein
VSVTWQPQPIAQCINTFNMTEYKNFGAFGARVVINKNNSQQRISWLLQR